MANAGRFGGCILGGWSTNFIVTVHTGLHRRSGVPRRLASRPDAMRCTRGRILTRRGIIHPVLHPAAFGILLLYRSRADGFSPLGGGPSQVAGPALSPLDFSIFKTFRVRNTESRVSRRIF